MSDLRNIWENRKLLGLILLGLLGIALLIYPGDNNTDEIPVAEQDSRENQVRDSNSPEMAQREEELSNQLEKMLSKIRGAGEVSVSVRLAGSTENQYAINTETVEKVTTEEDNSGGTRKIEQIDKKENPVFSKRADGSEQPVIENKIAPEISGIMVIARGAGDPEVKARLYRAVRVSLGVESHKIRVFPMERND